MVTNSRKQKARILELSKDDQKVCSSRVIWAKLQVENTGKTYRVCWAETPAIVGPTGVWTSKACHAFDDAWACEIGDIVWLYHAEDLNFNFFEPLQK